MLHGPSLTVAGHEASTTGSSTARAKHVKKKRKKQEWPQPHWGGGGDPVQEGESLPPAGPPRRPTQATMRTGLPVDNKPYHYDRRRLTREHVVQGVPRPHLRIP